jgi:NAD(P)-dependent dehydrogenase (short-subunit alcohol dehydrogenase family)
VHVRSGRRDYVVNNAGIEGEFAVIANLPEQESNAAAVFGEQIAAQAAFVLDVHAEQAQQ